MDAPNLADHSGGSAQRSSGPLVLTDAIELIADPRTSQHGASGPPSSATNDPQDQPRSISPVPSYRTYRSRADTFTQQNAPDRAIQQSSTHLIPLTPIKWTRPTLSFIIQNNPREFTYLALLVFILVATMSGWIVFMVLVPGAGLGTAVGADGPNFNTTNQAISIFGLNGLNDNIADSDFNDPFDDIDSADILETGLSGGGSLRRRRDEPPDSDSSDENDGADSGDLGNTALLSVNAGFLLV
ncbi:hypothetical protein BD324DRAFT_166659 [Kockovaella imperatae]|uniref:Transmembrane protein n=1 Tax=Kockovaella imperatae TaxID=4999 RepID=A0A1Y1U7Y1_9TREE|nr:hypothetical protein BD324DRAFT_166659 [Kockovaella imperatae]ORX34141.1 hypothetical protein BD324DRAFT_166659 [Kockovaella imperatae]